MGSLRALRHVARKFTALLLATLLPAGALAATTAVPVDLATSVQALPIILSGAPGCNLPPPPSLFGPGPETYSYGQTSVTTGAAGNHVLEVVDLVTPPGAPADPAVLVYQGAFNPADPATNLVACDDNGNVDPLLPPTFPRIVVSANTTYTVVVLVPEDAGFAPGTSTATLSSALEPTITFADKSVALGAAGESMTATSNSTGTISYAILNPFVALIDPNTGALTTNGTGSTPVAALQARDGGTYGSGVKEATLTVTGASAPTVSAIVPTSGSTAGGTSVTITGTNFTGATGVTIGGAAATSVVVVNPTTITAVTPAGSAGARDVAVTTPGGTGTGSALFTYVSPKLAFTTQPAGAVPGTAFTTQPQVTLQDGGGSTLTSATDSVTLAIKSGTGTPGAVLSCTANPVAAVAGVATFAGCKIDLAGTGYVLTATATGYTSADSNAISVAPPPPVVTFISPDNGLVTGGTHVLITGLNFTGVTSVNIGGAAATDIQLVSDTTIAARTPAGSAGARDVVVTTPNGSGTGSGIFTYVTPKLAFTTQPAGAAPGTAFTTQPAVTLQYGDGSTLTSATDSVTLAIKPGTGTPGAVLTCNTNPVAAVAGVATFAACGIDLAGTGYVLTATATGYTGVDSGAIAVTVPAPVVTSIDPTSGPIAGGTSVTITGSNFTGASAVTIGGAAATSVVVVNPTTITAFAPAGTAGARDVVVTTPGGTATGSNLYTYFGPAAQLVFTTQPAGAMGGAPFTTQPVVAIQDAGGNTVASSTATVALAISTGTGAAGAALQTCTSTAAVAGIATFTGCKIDKAGTGYRLAATAGSLAGESAPFNVAVPPVASKLAITTLPPATMAAGTIFSLAVTAQDALGNTATGQSGTVYIYVKTGEGKLYGVLAARFVAGVATFNDLYLSKAGTHRIGADAATLTSVTSPTITVTAPTAPRYITFSSSPAFEASGVPFTSQPVVKAISPDGSVFPLTGTVTLTAAAAAGTPTNPVLAGTLTTDFVAGIATFAGVKATGAAGSYVLTATAGSLGASTNFNLYADPAAAATSRVSEQAQSKTFTLNFKIDSSVASTNLQSDFRADICKALSLDASSCARILVTTNSVQATSAPPNEGAKSVVAPKACAAAVTGVGEVTVPPCMYAAPGTYRLEGSTPGFPSRLSNPFRVVDTLVGNLSGVPRNLTVQPGDGQAVVSWDPPQTSGAGNIVSYEVIGIRDGFPDQSLAKGLLTSKTVKLANGTQWRFAVKASNALGAGDPVQSGLVQIGGSNPSKPTMGSCTVELEETVAVGPEEGPGTGAVMTYGATGLELTDCQGGIANVTLTYPAVVEGMQVYTLVNGRWTMMPIATAGLVVQGTTATFPVADNGPLDADPQVGVISVVAGVGDLTGVAPFHLSSGPSARLANISTRMQVLTGDDVLIGGFIIGGTQPKTVVVRARGPSLTAAGVPNVLANPMLQLFSGATQIAVNDNWKDAANQATLAASGFAPAHDLESAIYTTLAPGAYTGIVTGVGSTTGVGIVEVFEVDNPDVPLINIAARGRVQTGDNVMIGGFIIQGDTPQTVIVRARGPSLAAAGVPGTLQNPLLQLFSGSTQIAVNDDWGTAANAGQVQAAGFAPSDSRESAILVTLNPGAYTAIVTGVGGTTGVGIIEVFAQ